MEKAIDYFQAMIDQLANLHFTACSTGALELTAWKMSLSWEREATKTIEALRVEVGKLKAYKIVEEKERTALEKHLSRARLAVKDAKAQTKNEIDLRLKAEADLAAKKAEHQKKGSTYANL